MELIAKLKALKQAKGLLKNTRSMDDLLARVGVMQTTYAGELMTTFLGDFKRVLKSGIHGNIPDKDWYFLQATFNQRIDEAVAAEETQLPILSTCAAGAPLIGLFGTVWGLIHSFMTIAEQRSADIAAVAPGIAEALITTLGGLIVAIPALAMYAYIQSQIRILEREVVDLSDTTLWIMRSISSPEVPKVSSFTATTARVDQEML